jgi:hypothetical protein
MVYTHSDIANNKEKAEGGQALDFWYLSQGIPLTGAARFKTGPHQLFPSDAFAAIFIKQYTPGNNLAPMSDEELKAELERLRNENAALKKGTSSVIRMKVSEKGGRFPVTLYKEKWLKLLDMSADIRAFIATNEAQLKTKD